MRELVAELREFAEASGEQVAVVFDGAPFEIDHAGPVDVAFASRRGRDAADDDIAARAAPGVTVVTSDSRLAERAREAGAEVLGAGGFRRRLERDG